MPTCKGLQGISKIYSARTTLGTQAESVRCLKESLYQCNDQLRFVVLLVFLCMTLAMYFPNRGKLKEVSHGDNHPPKQPETHNTQKAIRFKGKGSKVSSALFSPQGVPRFGKTRIYRPVWQPRIKERTLERV